MPRGLSWSDEGADPIGDIIEFRDRIMRDPWPEASRTTFPDLRSEELRARDRVDRHLHDERQFMLARLAGAIRTERGGHAPEP